MRRLALFAIVAGSIFTSSSSAWSNPCSVNPTGMSTIESADTLEVFVAEALNRADLALADRIIESQSKLDSNAIQWHFFRGMRSYIEISYEQDRQNEENIRKVQVDMEKAIEIGERRLETNPSDSIALFYTGGACGYLGIAQVQGGGGLFKGGSTAKKGFKYHERLVELCPGYYDAYLGPGLKNFMVSALPWVFKPLLYLLGLSGSEEKAEEYLTIAYEKGKSVRLEAGGYLAQFYARRKDWGRCRIIYTDLLKRYLYRVMLCTQSLEPFYQEQRYDQVAQRCREMMKRFENDRHEFTRSDSLSMLSIIRSCGYALRSQGKYDEAIDLVAGALSVREYKALNKWSLHVELGDLYRDQHRIREARDSYQKALTIAPEKYRKSIQKHLDNLPSMP